MAPVQTAAAASSSAAGTYPVGCDDLVFDVFAGTINGRRATSSQAEIQAQLPCASGSTPDGASFNVGGGVFFVPHGLYVYTSEDFIEVRLGFRGRVVPRLLDVSRADALAVMGAVALESEDSVLFDRAPGCVRLSWSDEVVGEVAAHARPCGEVAQLYASEGQRFAPP